jgi:hypothetical protein
MFKKNLNIFSRQPGCGLILLSRPFILAAIFAEIFLTAGCNLGPALPPFDLSASGWTTQTGQVVWRANRQAPEFAGELIVATNPDGRSFVQFTKTPLPFLVAESTAKSWQLHAVPTNKTYSGPGRPPIRALWLYLPRCLEGATPPKPLSWKTLPNHAWHLENTRTGEFLEGYLGS